MTLNCVPISALSGSPFKDRTCTSALSRSPWRVHLPSGSTLVITFKDRTCTSTLSGITFRDRTCTSALSRSPWRVHLPSESTLVITFKERTCTSTLSRPLHLPSGSTLGQHSQRPHLQFNLLQSQCHGSPCGKVLLQDASNRTPFGATVQWLAVRTFFGKVLLEKGITFKDRTCTSALLVHPFKDRTCISTPPAMIEDLHQLTMATSLPCGCQYIRSIAMNSLLDIITVHQQNDTPRCSPCSLHWCHMGWRQCQVIHQSSLPSCAGL
jgi:hypothetical protein